MDLTKLLDKALDLGDEGDWESMAELLREHLEEFEQEPAVHCWLGVAERELGMEGIAYERFKRVLALDAVDPYVLATAGNGLAAFDDPDAEQALRTAALTAPDVSLARFMYGAYLAREGQHEKALEELGAARELDPDEPQITYELGVAPSPGIARARSTPSAKRWPWIRTRVGRAWCWASCSSRTTASRKAWGSSPREPGSRPTTWRHSFSRRSPQRP